MVLSEQERDRDPCSHGGDILINTLNHLPLSPCCPTRLPVSFPGLWAGCDWPWNERKGQLLCPGHFKSISHICLSFMSTDDVFSFCFFPFCFLVYCSIGFLLLFVCFVLVCLSHSWHHSKPFGAIPTGMS